jgi:hypothetical protein
MTGYDATKRILVGLLIYLLLMALNVGPASAAPFYPEVVCKEGTFHQHDIAGVYETPWMQVIVAPCGGVQVTWVNDYGEHTVVYFSEARVPTGGVVMGGYTPDPELHAYLDSVPYAAITPMEPGYIKLTSLTYDGYKVREYRLRKIT